MTPKPTPAQPVDLPRLVRRALERALHAKKRGLYPLSVFEPIISFDSATADYYLAWESLNVDALEQLLAAWDSRTNAQALAPEGPQ